MDTILALTLKQCAQLDAKDADSLLNPISPGQQNLDLNAALQMLKPRNANTFPELSFNDPTTMFLLNSLLTNSLNPFPQQSLLSNTNSINSQNTNLDELPIKKQRLDSSIMAPNVQPTSPSNTASTSSYVSAISPQQCQSPWPALTVPTSQSPKKTKRKPPAPIPDEKKDDAYYERRKKNNDAAKRSRDARRMKEEQTANRAVNLEQENDNLRNEIASLKSEITKLRVLILANPSSGLIKPQPLSIGHNNEPSSSSD